MADKEQVELAAYSSEERLEAAKAMTTTMIEGTKLLVLINGGAAAGLVSGYPALRGYVSAGGLQGAALLFVMGLVAAGLIPLFYWMGQSIREGIIISRKRDPRHDRFLNLSAYTLYASLGFFAFGAMAIITSMK